MKMPVRREFEWNRIGSFRDANGFVIAFCYPRAGTPFIVKGGRLQVEEYIATDKSIGPVLCHIAYYWHNNIRDIVYSFFQLPDNIEAWISSDHILYAKSERHSDYTRVQQFKRVPRAYPRAMSHV